jgi:hypothetical protein
MILICKIVICFNYLPKLMLKDPLNLARTQYFILMGYYALLKYYTQQTYFKPPKDLQIQISEANVVVSSPNVL